MHHVNAVIFVIIALAAFLNVPDADGGFACLSNPCVHGVCLDDLNTTYSCYCIDGYTGVQCQTNWDECWSNPCQNGGICQDGIAAFNCTCPAGFVGDLCEENLNECLSNPCQNNGTCMDAANGYVCNCLPGYSGVHCELDIAVCNLTNETRCSNGGVCIEGPGVTFSCRCPDGWTGFFCELEVDECMSHPCQNGAVCVDMHADYECACLFGYTGRNCEEIVLMCDDNPCKNDALCLMEDDRPVCYCVPDFHGERCQFQYDECKLSNNRCLNGGTCIDGVDGFTCSCPPKLTGIYCECLVIDISGSTYLDCSYSTPTTPTTNATFMTETSPISLPSTTTILTTLTPITTREEKRTTTQVTTEVPKTDSTAEETVTTISSTISTSISDYSTTEQTTGVIITESPIIIFTTESVPAEKSTITSDIVAPTTTTEFTTTESEEKSEPTTPTTTELFTTDETTLSVSTGSTFLTELSTTLTTAEIPPMPSTTSEPLPISTQASSTESITTATEIPVLITTDTTMITTESEIVTAIDTTTPTSEDTTTSFSTNPEIITNATFQPTTSTTEEHMIISTTTETTSMSSIETEIITMIPETNITSTTFPLVTDFSSTALLITTDTIIQTDTSNSTTTTGIDYETTPTESMIFDCSKSQQNCNNGGTCVYMDGFYCLCPYDYSGKRCENTLGIKTAAFSGNSFLLHQVHTKSRLQIDFKARTTTANGLLFYMNMEETYMALYIEQGHLKFKFSCGFQTMLLTELNKPVNNGYEIRINALLGFSNDLKTCNASIVLNNTLSMSGAQIAKLERFVNTKSWLYLGGLNEKANPIVKLPGFIGCMWDLLILDKAFNIFKDAKDGFGITECSSLACLSNPCMNGGSCTILQGDKYLEGDAYFCKCRNGFVGIQCEHSVCDNNPCKFGGTCLQFAGSGYICLCPFGKHGHFCENDLKISKAYYSSSVQGYASYTSYPIPKGNYKYMQIKFTITPSSINQIALLMFMGQSGEHDFYSDHMAVSFVKGYIMLTWNLGAGPRRIFTSKPIPADKASYDIQVGRLGRRAWLHVEHLGNVTGRSKAALSQLDIEPVIYFGGYKTKDYEGLPHDLPLHSGFTGCIFDIEFKIGDITLALENKQVSGRAVGQCGTTECYEGVCQNEGVCLYHGGTFTCMCQDNYYGPLCSSKMNLCDRNQCRNSATCSPTLASYECDCPLGYKGKYCDTRESLSDVSFTGIRSYLILPPEQFNLNKVNFDLEMRPFNDGLISFIGNDESFFSLTFISGLLELRVKPRRQRLNNQEIFIVRSNKMLRLGQWHQIKITIYGRKIFLFVDNIVNTGNMQPGDILDLSNQNIYLGGLPDMSKFPPDASCEFSTYYTGCIRKLFIDSRHIVLNEETILQGQNVVDCDGTPCGGDYCMNGGTCWLDPNLQPHCKCQDPFFGEKCQSVYCNELKCNNHGHCMDDRCVCKLGYTGALCETSITIKKPKFTGRSYLYVNVPGNIPAPRFDNGSINVSAYKKRDSLSDQLSSKNISITFRTASDGLLLHAKERSQRYLFMITLWNGKLVINDDTQSIELFSAPLLNDGDQHELLLQFKPFRLSIDSQNYDVKTFSSVEFDEFYLGGIPNNTSIVNITGSLFDEMFEGCIENLTGSALTQVTENFNMLEGENIDDCSNIFN